MGERRSVKEAQVALSVRSSEASGEIVKASKRTRKQPYKRTEKLIDTLWSRLACGESMIDICRDPKMPARQTIMKWMAEDDELEQMIDDAYKWKARYFGEAILDVAEGGSFSTGDIRRDELKVKALMWLAGKYNRKVFGDSQQIEVTDTRPVINLPAQFQGFGLPVIEGEISDVEPEGKDENKL
tara:strand:+ start:536 stop:1087 length:552 start_codon:yes stop_codon:yes gene_type:complete